MRLLAPCLWLVAGCPHVIDDQNPCDEAGFSIAARADQCTGDAAIGEALYEAFLNETTCIVGDIDETSPLSYDPVLAYDCALVTRNLACELAIEYGDDLSLWLKTSPVCDEILAGP